jgi:hypothetical protein
MGKFFVGVLIGVLGCCILSYSIYRDPSILKKKESVAIEEKVLPVIGRVTLVFDGQGATMGLLVKDGDDLKILHYDQSSSAANTDFQPKYVSYVKFTNGNVAWNPLTVEVF